MALNREEILKQYQAAATIASEKAKGLTQKVAGAKTFAGDLQSRIAKREISPEAVRRERETVSQVFAAPEEMRTRLRDTRLLPSEVGALVGGRMNTYLDQLQSIRDSRSARQQRIDNIVEEAASGVKAQAEIAGIEVDTLRDTRNELWRQYTESQRQYEFGVKQASTGDTKTSRTIALVNGIRDMFAKLNTGDDGGYDPKYYVQAREVWFNTLGTYDNFDTYFPVNSLINVVSGQNAVNNIEVLGNANIDVYGILRDEDDEEILSDLKDIANEGNADYYAQAVDALIKAGVVHKTLDEKMYNAVKNESSLYLLKDVWDKLFPGENYESSQRGYSI